MNLLLNWKTTLAGITLFAVAALKIAGVDVPGFAGDPGALIIGGIGLIFAKDAGHTGVA
jgi:hypothetical protein